MKIYKITCGNYIGYDFYDSHIIVANNKYEVIELAKLQSADEGEEVWDSGKIECIGPYEGLQEKPFILLSSFNAG